MDVTANIMEFRKDPFFAEFLNDNFNLQQCLSVIKDLSFNEQLEKISFGIEFVKQNISNLTSHNCEEFFQRTSQLDCLYQELQFIQIRAQSLSKTMNSIQTKLEEPYCELMTEMSSSSSRQRVCDLLRKMLRIIHLSKRIFETDLRTFREENDGNIYQRELIKTSQYLNEVNIIIEQEETAASEFGSNLNELYKINLISGYLTKIATVNDEALLEADRMLRDGIDRSSEGTVGTALLVFYNLGVLQPKCTCLTKELLQQASKILQQKLHNSKEIRAPSNNEMLQLRLQESLDDIQRLFLQMLTVFKVLKKKRENFNQKLLIEYLQSGEEILLQFWNDLIVTLSSQLNRICQDNRRIKLLFEENYHQFLVIFIEFHNKMMEYDCSIQNGRNSRNIIHNFESSYLSSSINGLFEVVNQMFKNNQATKSTKKKQFYVPMETDIEKFIDKIKTELLLAGCDKSHLLSAASKNVQQATNLLIVKCEHLALVDGDASQVIGPITKSQQHNVQLIKCLRFFEVSFKNLLLKHVVFEDIQSDFNDVYKNISQLIVTIVEPLMASLEDALEAIILTMHSENYLLQKSDNSCSLYIRELQSFLNRSWNDYLKCLGGNDDETIQGQIHKLANKTIDMFALNTCLLGPISAFGRQRIHQDFEAFEKAIEPLCDRTGPESRSFQILRALKSIILLPPEMIHKSATIGNPVPVSLIVTFLISNYGQNEISIQKYLDYSTPRYLKWYQTCDEEQIITKIRECLVNYSNRIRKQNKTNYVEIYPVLMDLMNKF